jgi:RNA polymerase sigma factor (TIGR02999 family)
MADAAGDVTALLAAWSEGDREALDQLVPLVYEHLRRLAHGQLRGERRDGTLGTTALVHEAYLRLVDQGRARLESRSHFFSLAARMMRRVLVDAARKRHAGKRGAGSPTLPIDDVAGPSLADAVGLLEVDDVLGRLEKFDERLARVVELRYFGGLSFEEIAETLDVSTATAWRDWQVARAWLHDTLKGT